MYLDKTSKISVTEFRNLVFSDDFLQNFRSPPIDIYMAEMTFNEVDTNKDGLISPQEARQSIILAGERIPGGSFGHIIQMFDDNHDGQMSLEEFLNNVQKLVHE
ncbi:unnamed protein product [Rotaria sordida]|uniref:EF-hand domain-containing protein n=1 Tax=Rotaria sordida TaxID=392033 RepID=A0A815RZ47_9BILA|nr:unnamed protein product [Rotaria sordida]CAF1483865.1 unnamed protein product [Rotaria sordida]